MQEEYYVKSFGYVLLKIMTMKQGIEKLSEEDREFKETYGQTLDFTDRNNIIEITNYCKLLNKT